MSHSRVERHLPLKPLTYSVLIALRASENYGYGIAKRVAEPAGGGIRLAPSNLYHVLDRLTAMGLIEATERLDPGDRRRTYYGLTALGRDVLAAETARVRAVLGTAEALEAARGET